MFAFYYLINGSVFLLTKTKTKKQPHVRCLQWNNKRLAILPVLLCGTWLWSCYVHSGKVWCRLPRTATPIAQVLYSFFHLSRFTAIEGLGFPQLNYWRVRPLLLPTPMMIRRSPFFHSTSQSGCQQLHAAYPSRPLAEHRNKYRSTRASTNPAHFDT